VALAELKEAIDNMSDKKDDGFGRQINNVDKKARQKEYDVLKAEYDSTRNDKTEYLQDVTTNIFGSKTVKTNFTKKAQRTQQNRRANKDPKVDRKKKNIETNNEKLNDFNEVTDKLKEAIKDGDIISLMSILETFKGKISPESSTVLERVLNALNTQQVSDISIDDKKGFSGGYGAIAFPSDISVQPVGNLDMTLDKFVEIVGHEVDHAINLRYIQDQISGKSKTSAEIKYIQKVLARLPKLLKNNKFMDDKVAERIQYMLEPKQATAVKKMSDDSGISEHQIEQIFMVTEFTSMMRNEPDVRDAILEAFGSNQTIMDKVISLVQKAYEFAKKMGPDFVSQLLTNSRKNNNFSANNILLAVESLQINAAVATDNANSKGELESSNYNKKKDNSDPYDGDEWANVNPRHYAQYVISKQNSLLSKLMFGIGGGVVDIAAPALMKGHRTMNRKSDLYKGAVGLIRTGFWDSEFANKMKVMLGTTGDVDEKLMNDFLSLGTDIIQKSKDLETKNLPKLDNKIKELYPDEKEQVKIYQLFAKTGIADIASDEKLIKNLFNGKKTIDEMIKDLTKKWTADEVKESEGLSKYYITGKTDTNLVNTSNRGLFSTNARQVVALMALRRVDNGQQMLVDMDKSVRNELFELAVIVKSTSDNINHQAPRADGKSNENNAEYNDDYDGHYTKDVHDKIYEYKTVSEQDMKYGKYPVDKDWVVIKEPSQGHIGVVAREMIGAGNTPGIGLNLNRFENGFFLDSDETLSLKNKLDKMENSKPGSAQTYLEDNNIVKLKGKYKFIIDENTKRDKLGLVQSAAHSLYRTLIHNKELIEMQSVRDMVLQKGTKDIDDETQMRGLSNLITRNKNGSIDDRKNIPMFLNIKYDFNNFDSLPKRIKDMYKRPENLSTYNNFNQKVTLVRRDMADQLIGHKNFQIFGGDNRKMARTEKIFKGLIVHAKMLMVVTAPVKLAVDMASNIGILSAMDVSIFDMPKNFNQAFKDYKSFSMLRGKLVQAEIAALSGDKRAIKNRDNLQNKIEKHNFYKAFQSGFVQSYSTDLMVKEFDTISGLQKDIESVVNYLTTTDKGKKNEVHKAMKWWMEFGSDYGFTVDALLRTASMKTKLDGTSMGDTMIEMADRLKRTRDGEDMSAYVSNIIGAPSSEIVSVGGSIMVISDALSKKVLADTLQKQINPSSLKIDLKIWNAAQKITKMSDGPIDRTTHEYKVAHGPKPTRMRKYTEDEAYMKANQTFIDFRVNMPSEVKALSDYGILMFPNFWMKTQRVIASLIMYHPLPAAGGYLAEYMIGVQQASILDANIVSKIYNENVFHNPGEAVGFGDISPFF
ncbi:MAG: hypothetical protein J7L15_00600, partial [Clostridiales bacterium]|nr:hypothetical protein [Clostridiales bacterium]